MVNSEGKFPLVVVLLEGQKAPGLQFLQRLHWIITADPTSYEGVMDILRAHSPYGILLQMGARRARLRGRQGGLTGRLTQFQITAAVSGFLCKGGSRLAQSASRTRSTKWHTFFPVAVARL
jgi:hypothetical protein